MTDLASNYNRPSAGPLPYIQPLPVKAAANIIRGGLTCTDANGLAVRAANTAGLRVAGTCVKEYDNTDGADGTLAPAARWCQVQAGLWSYACAGSPKAGLRVYAVDTDNVTTVAGNVPVGVLWEPDPETSGNWYVFVIAGVAGQTLATIAASIVDLTDSTGLSGTHDDTLAATTVPADLTGGESPTEAEFNALLAVIRVMAQNASDTAQKVKEIVAALDTAGVTA